MLYFLHLLFSYFTRIGADDVLILTGALQLEKDSSRPAVERFGSAFRSAFVTMLTTSVTTAAAFGMTAVIKIPTVRYFAVFCSLMVTINFMLVNTLYLYCLILWDRYLRFRSLRTCKPMNHQDTAVHRLLQHAVTSLGKLVTRHPFKVLSVFGAATAIFTVFAALLGDPNSRTGNPYWDSESLLGRRWSLELIALQNHTGSDGISLRLVVGIETIDRTGTDPTADNDLGRPVFYDGFDLAQPDAQEHILWLCDQIEASGQTLSVSRVDCFMRDLKQWRLSRQQGFPIIPASHFNDAVKLFLTRDASTDVQDQLGFMVDGENHRLRFANIHVITSVPNTARHRGKQDLKDQWNAFVPSLNSRKTPPASCGPAFIVSAQFLFASTIEGAKATAWISVGASTAIACAVLLLFTRNIRIAALASLVIGCIVVAVVGSISIFGWKMDVFESICITILVGFSVDYTVHLGVAYVDCQEVSRSDRKARAMHAISTLGISVTAGATSTAGACLFLFPATILFLPKFGQFMVTAVVAALLYAMCAFIALLAVVGPIDDQGNVSFACLASLLSRCSTSKGSSTLEKDREETDMSGIRPDVAWPSLEPAESEENRNQSRLPSTAFRIRDPEAPSGTRNDRAKCPRRAPFAERNTKVCLAAFAMLLAGLLGGSIGLQLQQDANISSKSIASTHLKTVHMPTYAQLDAGWNQMRPAGRTSCSRGDAYHFYVRKGRTDRVILEFMGGGACWSPATCGLQQPTFTETTAFVDDLFNATMSAAPARPIGGKSTPGQTEAIRDTGLADPAAGMYGWTQRNFVEKLLLVVPLLSTLGLLGVWLALFQRLRCRRQDALQSPIPLCQDPGTFISRTARGICTGAILQLNISRA